MTNKENKLKACDCGSKEFYLFERLIHAGKFVDGVLVAKSGETDGIDYVECQECGEKYEHLNCGIEFC